MPRGAEPLVIGDHTGFTSIFDGTSLKDWDGDPAFWRVEGGAIVGREHAGEPDQAEHVPHLARRRAEDFELKVEFRMSATNSGIQVRSVQLARPVHDIGKWVMKGYQADIDFDNQFTGQIYEERGRGFLAMRGQARLRRRRRRTPVVIGNLQQTPDELKALIKANDWNQVHLIARGNTITADPQRRGHEHASSTTIRRTGSLSGLIGFQMHVGEPMRVEFRNIWLKKF